MTGHNMSAQMMNDLGEHGVEDMVHLTDLNETSLLWNIRLRYDQEMIYTFAGSILVAVNPYKMFDVYGLDMVKKYEGQILGTLPPHLFATGSAAYSKMTKDNEDQVVVISGESGSGKTESTKLIMQYLAAVNKSASNIVTEQILEASPLLESFGNAKTVKNNNSSRFGKYLEIHFKDGVITGAKTTEYLLEKSRIVTQAQEERNYHVFYELLNGLSEQEKEKYGLQTADKYFYLNQGGIGCAEIEGKNDGEDFRFLLAAMQVLGFTNEEQDTIFRILAAVLHLGNIYFHRKQLKHGQEGVEIGSDAEVRWSSHLLQLNLEGILKALTFRTTEARGERLLSPLNIDQALDARDAIAKALYSSLFSWLVQRINLMVYKGSKKTTIALLDIFGFEDFKENSFEQLCINYANETLQYYFSKYVFKLEQQEYFKEKIEWNLLSYTDNQLVLNLISQKPMGILPLLDDESNFPKATDQSFLEKCHYNHSLKECYSRPRVSSMEFGIKHYAGQVWYSVDGFLDKNRSNLRPDVVELLISSKMPMISKMFQELRHWNESVKTFNRSDGRFITMKPRTPTVATRFQDSLNSLLENMSKCTPWFVRCIKPNNEKAAMKLDMNLVLEQLRYTGMLETTRIRQIGYPIRLKFSHFVARYRCLISGGSRSLSTRETCRLIFDTIPKSNNQYQLGSTKIFLRESLEQSLEKERVKILRKAVVTVQRNFKGYLARKRFRAMVESAIKIQAAFRGYSRRRDYVALKRGITRAQASWKMKVQRREYEKIRAILARKREADRLAMERVKEKVAREEKERVSRAVAGVNHLEIPAELAFIFTKLEEWQPSQSDKNIVKAVGQIDLLQQRHRLPGDIDHHAFTKFINIYFRAHIWGMKREPIKTPFLAKSNEADHQESLAIFKLLLRFMNDNNLSGKKEKVLADYIIQQGLSNEALRDEILCQLCNQTWKNENVANNERGWQLMANSLSCFPPSSLLYKYLLKYVSDHGHDGYKAICQHKMLQSERVEPQNARTYPPCLLEWKANNKRANMALEAKFADGDSKYAAIESWTSGEAFAADLLEAKGLDASFGWTVDLSDDGDIYELNGSDYVFDLVSETEIPPSFPVNKSFFLVSADRTKSKSQRKFTSCPHDPERINKYEANLEEPVPVPSRKADLSHRRDPTARSAKPSSSRRVDMNGHTRARSVSREHLVENSGQQYHPQDIAQYQESSHSYVQSLSHTNSVMSLDRTDMSLSRSSRLNQRYLKIEATRTRSDNNIKLSETSKLNKRYAAHRPDAKQPSGGKATVAPEVSSLSKRSHSLQELGLASSALNDRYFHSRQELHKASSVSSKTDCLDGPMGTSSAQPLKGANDRSFLPEPVGEPMAHKNKYRKSGLHTIRPSSRSSSSSLSSEGSNGANFSMKTADSHGGGEREDSGSSGRAAEMNSRYVKYTGRPQSKAKSRHPPNSHSTKAYIDKSATREMDFGYGPRSSAMSDTSEAPSLASHVRNIKIPSQTSDLDQYLDDLFNPVLDGNLDELSDARSLAASIKGGSDYFPDSGTGSTDQVGRYINNVFDDILEEEYSSLSDPTQLAKQLKGGNGCSISSSFESLSQLDDLNIDVSSVGSLTDPNRLSNQLKGGGSQGDVQTQSTITFGTNSSRKSPQTPSENSGSFSPGAAQMAQQQGPPTINTNMPFTNVAGMTVPMVDTSQIIQQQLVHQQMIQRAFLASAVQQNLQIQQQLLQQNQALQQLLHTGVSPNSMANEEHGASPTLPALSPFSPLLQTATPSMSLLQSAPMERMDSSFRPVISPYPQSMASVSSTGNKTPDSAIFSRNKVGPAVPPKNSLGSTSLEGIPEAVRYSMMSSRSSSIPPPPPPPPPSPPPLSPSGAYSDVYGRAKTVRIGKWRWPPPRGETEPTSESNFFEFKLKKQQEKHDKTGENGEKGEEPDRPETIFIHNGSHIKRTSSSQSIKQKQQSSRTPTPTANDKAEGSVGKLRISSEMKAKLEMMTKNQSVRSSKKDDQEKLTRSMEDVSESSAHGVKKLSDHRKALLEKQLMGSMRTLSEFQGTTRQTVERRVESADNIHMKHSQSDLSKKSEREQPDGLVRIEDRFAIHRRSGSRETRERRDELGPHNRNTRHSTAASTVQAECGDHLSHSIGASNFFDDISTRNGSVYAESIASSRKEMQVNASRPVKRMSVPPPPPPERMDHTDNANQSVMNPTYQCIRHLGPPSIAASSSFYAPSTPLVIRRKEPPPPPMLTNAKVSQDRLSLDRLEFIESSEFLNPVDAPPPSVVDRRGHRANDTLKTKLFPANQSYYLTYTKVPWELKVRKEIFSPTEKIENPLTLHLIFCQVVKDSLSKQCVRLTREERHKLHAQLNNYGITSENMHSSVHKLSVQRNIVDFAKELPTYFCRLYPVSGGQNLPNVHLLGVSHSGVRLLQRERDAVCDYLKVVDTLSFDEVADLSVPRNSTLQLLLRTGGWITLFTHKANQIRQLIDRFTVEVNQNEAEFVRAVSDHLMREPSLLSFQKGDVIRIVKNKNLHIAKGWFYGVLETGEGGIFPCEYVVPLNKQELQIFIHKMSDGKVLQNGNGNGNVKQNGRRDLNQGSDSSMDEEATQENSCLWIESKTDQVDDAKSDVTQCSQVHDGKFSLLQFALCNFKEALEKYELVRNKDGSLNESINLMESLKSKKKKKKNGDGSDWTWRELSDLVKFTSAPLQAALLGLGSQDLNKLALECFIAIMRYMGDYSMSKTQTEVDCVYTALVNCHKYPQLRDEVYCQIMKQTTNNKSSKLDSCQRGWRLFSIIAAYFDCSENLRPYLFKYLETAAYDKRRAYHATALLCLQNLRKTLRFGGRKNVPSVEEIAAISAGRNSKRQMYRLPGGTERIINTKSTTVVNDVIEEICSMLNVRNPIEMEEFSLYCIVEGDPYTMPLNRDEYILDVTTELLKNGQIFYLIFCRSVWFYPLRLDSQLYIEVIFNQVAPDYLEGLLLITPEEKLSEELVPDIARIAALLHRAADMDHMPTRDEVKYLLPKPVLPMRDIRPPQWVEMVQQNWSDMSSLTTTEAKAQCLDILQKWLLFGSCFFAVKRIQSDSPNHQEFILALNKDGVHFLDTMTHENELRYSYAEVISTRKVRAEDGTLFLDMKCGNLMVQKITRIQTDQAHEISRLIRQYIDIQNSGREDLPPQVVTLSRAAVPPAQH